MADALEAIVMRPGRARTPQTEQADERQVKNNAGGYSFQVAGEARLHRFLTLGSEGGTYYVSEQDLTKDNAKVVIDWAKNRTRELVRHVVDISVTGRAPRQQPALFALAAAISFGDAEGKKAAEAAVLDVVRTGTHLFTFVKYAEQLRGWGPVLRRAVARWYQEKEPENLAYQLVKYRQREGWTHADVLRSAHPKPATPAHDGLYKWAVGKSDGGPVSKWVNAYEAGRKLERGNASGSQYVQLIQAYPGLPWEALPDVALTKAEVWAELIDKGMPQTALLRNLPKLTKVGVLPQLGGYTSKVCDQLRDPERLRKARVHPVSVLLAAKTYASGVSARGSSTWTPNPKVVDALSDAFYAAYGAVQPAGKRTMLALDISGSMAASAAGLPITCREASAALALVTLATEPECGIFGFSHNFIPLTISASQRLDDVVRSVSGLPFGGTDCSLPMQWAQRNKVEVDTFQVYTDSETWFGDVHPHQALENYRQASGIPARLAVVGIASTYMTIADPGDPGSMDVSGFDSAVPSLLADFSRGDI